MKRLLKIVAVAAALLLQTSLATAGPNEIEADLRMKEGRKLALEGRYDEALGKYVQAYALDPQPNVLLGMAIVEHQLGRDAEALAHLRRYLKKPDPKNEKDLRDTLLRDLERSVAQVRIEKPDGTELSIDGAPAGDRLVDDVVALRPGEHVLAAGTERRTVRAEAGTTIAVDLTSPAQVPSSEPAHAIAAPPLAEPPPDPTRDGPSPARIATTAGLGAAAVAAGILGIVFRSNAGEAVDESRAIVQRVGGCRGVTSPDCARVAELEDDRDRNVTLSTVSFIGAGALLAGAAAVYLLWPDSRDARTTGRASVWLAPHASPHGAGAFAGLSF